MILAMSAGVAARVSAPDAPKRRLGESEGARLDFEFATGPA